MGCLETGEVGNQFFLDLIDQYFYMNICLAFNYCMNDIVYLCINYYFIGTIYMYVMTVLSKYYVD